MRTATSITVRVPLTIRRRSGRKTVVMPVGREDSAAAAPTRADPALVKALARAFRYQKLLDEGRYASISDMAVAERIERGYLGTLLRLTLLAPDIVEALLDATLPATLPSLLILNTPGWRDQGDMLAGGARAPMHGAGQPRERRPPSGAGQSATPYAVPTRSAATVG